MVNISVCEENDVTRRIIIGMLNEIKNSHDFNLWEIGSGKEFLTQISGISPDIILINETFNKNGYEAAKLLRDNGYNSDIIFLTSFPENITRAFDFNPSACIVKPMLFEDIEKSILTSIDHIGSSRSFVIRTRRSSTEINLDDIIYIEADKRYTNIRTTDRNYECTENIGTLEQRLPGLSFFRSHRTYILNFKYISSMDNNLIHMSNGEFVILSRNRKGEFEKAYENYKKKKTT